MKKFVLLSFLLLGFYSVSEAAWPWQQAPDKTATVRYRVQVALNTTTTSVVIALSTSTSWPHYELSGKNNEINISSIKVELDKVAASSVSVKLGVLTYVDTSSGTVSWFTAVSSSRNVSNTNLVYVDNFNPTFLRLKTIVPSGLTGGTPYLLTNETTSLTSLIQTDTNLPSTVGSTMPGRGDVVMQIINYDNTNPVVVTVNVQYHVD